MTDPTLDEMREVLLGLYGVDADDEAEIAIYWFAVAHHTGLASRLYSAACWSRFRPGPIATLESEGEMSLVRMMYDDLVAQFVEE